MPRFSQKVLHSPLISTSLLVQNVWSVANSPGQAELQRHEFYVAMRTVALAQGGEATLTRQRVRETAEDSIAIATFKGMPTPPLKCSTGKKQQPIKEAKTKEQPKTASKKKTTVAGKGANATPAPTTTGKLKKAEKTPDYSNKENKNKAIAEKSSTKNNKGDRKVANKVSAKPSSKGVAADTPKKTPSPKKVNSSGSSSSSSSGGSSSGAGSGSDGDGDDSDDSSSRSEGEETDNSGNDDDDPASRAGGEKRGNNKNNEGCEKRKERDHGTSGSELSADGKEEGKNSKGRRGEEESRRDDDDGEASDSDSSSSRSVSDSSSSVGSSKSLGGDDGGGGGESTSVVDNGKARSRSSSGSSTSSSSSSSDEEGPDRFSMSEKARARYQVREIAPYVYECVAFPP